jgi:hypothetical protein
MKNSRNPSWRRKLGERCFLYLGLGAPTISISFFNAHALGFGLMALGFALGGFYGGNFLICPKCAKKTFTFGLEPERCRVCTTHYFASESLSENSKGSTP